MLFCLACRYVLRIMQRTTMKLFQLQYFIAVAEALNFHKAAQRSNITQPPLSRQVRGLEDEFGIQLFVRNHEGVHLTDSGRLLLREARSLMKHVERVKEVVGESSNGRAGSLNVGVAIGLAENIRRVEIQHTKQFPEVDIQYKEIFSTLQNYVPSYFCQSCQQYGTSTAAGVSCPALSRLGDIYGYKKLAIITLLLTSLGIFIDVIAPTYVLFLIGRFFLGLCPAIVPLAVGIFRNLFSKETTLFGIGIVFASLAGGHAVGTVFAAYIFDGTGSIAWVFASWLTLFIPAIFIMLILVPKIPAPSERPRMDWPGAITLGIGVGCLLFGLAYGPLEGWGSRIVVGAFCFGFLSLIVWYLAERRAEHPLVDLRLLGNQQATWRCLADARSCRFA
jgi:hypothetical protein